MLIDYCSEDNPKIKVHIFNVNENDEKQFFHSKCYIFSDGTDDFNVGIIGSSNFTEKGLNGNSELNYLEINPMIVNNHEQASSKPAKFCANYQVAALNMIQQVSELALVIVFCSADCLFYPAVNLNIFLFAEIADFKTLILNRLLVRAHADISISHFAPP